MKGYESETREGNGKADINEARAASRIGCSPP